TIPSLLSKLESCKSLTPNKTSLYRDLENLVSACLLEEVAAPGRATAYKQAQYGHHHHHIYRDCQKVIEIEVPTIESALASTERSLSREQGFARIDHEVTFLGTCADCSK